MEKELLHFLTRGDKKGLISLKEKHGLSALAKAAGLLNTSSLIRLIVLLDDKEAAELLSHLLPQTSARLLIHLGKSQAAPDFAI